MSTELKRKQKTFPKVHKRKGRIVGHNIKIECCAKSEFKRQRGDKQLVNARGRQATNKNAAVLQSLRVIPSLPNGVQMKFYEK